MRHWVQGCSGFLYGAWFIPNHLQALELLGLTNGDRWDLPHNWMKMLVPAIIQIFFKMTFIYLRWVELCVCAGALVAIRTTCQSGCCPSTVWVLGAWTPAVGVGDECLCPLAHRTLTSCLNLLSFFQGDYGCGGSGCGKCDCHGVKGQKVSGHTSRSFAECCPFPQIMRLTLWSAAQGQPPSCFLCLPEQHKGSKVFNNVLSNVVLIAGAL